MIKKLIYILILFIISANNAFAASQHAEIEYKDSPYSYHNLNIQKVFKSANSNMLLYENSKIEEEKKKYLEHAMKGYYLITKADCTKIDAFIGLGRVYDAKNLDKLSKEYFSKALNMDKNNPSANYYYGNFYFKRREYIKSLFYYKVAYNHGYSKNIDLNYRLAIIYEKLADIETAKIFYKIVNSHVNDDGLLDEKIRLLDELNYSQSQYYLFNKNNK